MTTISRTTISRIASTSLLAFSLALGACGGSTAAEGNVQSAQNASTAPVGQNTHGVVKLVGSALGQVPLRPDQRTELERLATEAETRHQSVAPARTELVNAIATQVEAGTIDRAALQPKIDAAVQAWNGIRDQDRAAFERLHAILDPNQRTQFVEAFRAQMHGEHGEHGEHDVKAEHHHGGPKGELHAWMADLHLTDVQKDQLRSAFQAKMKEHGGAHAAHSDWKEHHARAGKVMDAFRSDHFVMDEVAPRADAKAMGDKFGGRMLSMIETALPILTPEQRKIAADKIRAHAAAGDHAPF